MQGYQAVLMLWMNITNGNDLGGGKPVLTGPSIVDKTNIDQILPYTAEQPALTHLRLRGEPVRPCPPSPAPRRPLGSPGPPSPWSRP